MKSDKQSTVSKEMKMPNLYQSIAEIAGVCIGKDCITSELYDKSLTEQGMDSLMFVRMVVEVEEYFCIEIPDELLLRSELDTIQRFAEIVQELKMEDCDGKY